MTRIHPIIDYTLRPSTGHNPAPTDDYIEPLFIRKRLTWVPSRDEMALRQSLAHELCTQLYPDHDGSHPWATEASVLLLMPLDRLKRLVDQCQPKDGVADKDNRAISSTHAVLVNMVGYVLFFMQGKQLDAGYGTRFPLTDDDVRIRCCPEAAEEVPRNEVEAEKCLERDKKVCIFSGHSRVEACNIVPFTFNASNVNLETTDRQGLRWEKYFPSEPRYDAVFTTRECACSDKAWNLLAIHPYLHALWGEQRWGIECTGITPTTPVGADTNREGGGQHAVHLTFHWLPQSDGDDHRTIDFGPSAEGFQVLLDDLREQRQRAPSYGEKHAEYTAAEREAILSIPSGRTFEVTVDTEDDAKKMRAMIDLQWTMVRIAALSGSVVPDLNDVYIDDDLDAFGLAYMLS